VSANTLPPDVEYRAPLPRNRNVGIGCIGAGFIMADCHLVAYQQAGLNPVAIASRDPKHARSVAERHGIPRTYDHYRQLLEDRTIEVLDVAVPPDIQAEVIGKAVQHADHIRGILAQKPLGRDFTEAREIVRKCQDAGIVLAVNQNMRHDQSVRACKGLLERGYLGEPILATIEMRAVPHWQPWQERLGWVTLRIMSIHHLDTFRFWFGDPDRVFASIRPDPRTAEKFAHEDGVCLYILEYANGLRATGCDDVWAGPTLPDAAPDHFVRWRVEGTEGLARGTIGWPSYPTHTPSTLDFASRRFPGGWHAPRWPEAWFPEAFAGPMAELLTALEEGTAPPISGADNLRTMALVEACYRSAQEHRVEGTRDEGRGTRKEV
jgi:predicted dehydrogenase